MRMRVIAVGTRMPAWVDAAFADYAGRLPRTVPLELRELPVVPRGRARDGARGRGLESERIARELRPGDFVIGLCERGRELTTRELATWLGERMQGGRDLAFLIGGPDGLDTALLARADFSWSLSRLTLPHALARVVLAEQLYRAHALLQGHPYHRD